MNRFEPQDKYSALPPADTDVITGLPNYVALVRDLPKMLLTRPLSLLGIDIECLGHLNETQGTEAGDAAIRCLAEHLCGAKEWSGRKVLRSYRLDGDEFAVFIQGETSDALALGSELALRVSSSPVCPAFRYLTRSIPEDYEDALKTIIDVWIELRRGRGDGPQMHSPAEGLLILLSQKLGHLSVLFDNARRLAYFDDVSSLPNSRSARLYAARELKRCRDKGKPMSLLFVDGDNLRQYNDDYGYESGNQMIRSLGETLRSGLKEGERIARWLSGDEFMIVLPEKPASVALERAKELCALVEEKTGTWVIPITVSIGVAGYPDHGDDLDTLIVKVQDANYLAKKLGKNQASQPPQSI